MRTIGHFLAVTFNFNRPLWTFTAHFRPNFLPCFNNPIRWYNKFWMFSHRTSFFQFIFHIKTLIRIMIIFFAPWTADRPFYRFYHFMTSKYHFHVTSYSSVTSWWRHLRWRRSRRDGNLAYMLVLYLMTRKNWIGLFQISFCKPYNVLRNVSAESNDADTVQKHPKHLFVYFQLKI